MTLAYIEKLMQSDCVIGSIVSLNNDKMFHVTQTPHEPVPYETANDPNFQKKKHLDYCEGI